MRSSAVKAVFLATMTAICWGHAVVQIPTPRKTGAYQVARCGTNVTKALEKDKYAPINVGVAKIDAAYKCNIYLCRGYQYEDNMSALKSMVAGQVVTFHIDLAAAHKPGWANVSVVDLATNKVIGTPLKSWSVWPDAISGGGDDVDFNITIPTTLGTKCNSGGKCAMQWYWWSSSNSQTYESCVDFYLP